ncbi:putative vesicle-associated membrane-protein-associated protein [Rosa chinensis]|uniref:Putative vesicle-associated membrane-protein-associated protein n=1 Tax=Rosa chinensis TaxID=74649 RepID=A0A2P6RLE4_ROSCH|nr:putative vesicle-associated membrane-protein-associated protein [Rosa chinensis]
MNLPFGLMDELVHDLVASAFAFSLGLGYGNIKNAQGLQVFRFVEQPDSNEKILDQKTKVKFQIMSLKVKAEIDYAPELVNILLFPLYALCGLLSVMWIHFWEIGVPISNWFLMSKRIKVAVERILRIVFLDAEHPTPAHVGEGLVIDEWVLKTVGVVDVKQVDFNGLDKAPTALIF